MQKVSDILESVRELRIEGFIVPFNWLKEIRKPAGPYYLAAYILADIVHWYNPVVEYDEETNEFKGFKKKFSGELLQRSHAQYSEMFGVTKQQTLPAITELIKRGLIKKVIKKSVITESGKKLSNVMYLYPVPEKIKEITFPKKEEQPELIPESDSSPDDTPKPKKEIKHDKEITEAINYLNEKTGRRYNPKAHTLYLNARFNDGYTIDDVKTVIDNKVFDWITKPDMNKFLRPQTLFGSKFDSYLNEKPRKPKKEKTELEKWNENRFKVTGRRTG